MKKLLAITVGAGLILAAAYHALMFYDNNFRYGRMRETPAVRPHEEPLHLMEEGLVPVSGGEAALRAAGNTIKPAVDMSDPNILARGRAVYRTYCAQCHGANQDGQGTVGQSFHPLPTDLRSPAVQSKPPGELFQTVSYGIPGGRQPALDTTVTVEDRWSVIAFVKGLGLNP